MARLELLEGKVNRVALGVDREGARVVNLWRAERAKGPFRHLGEIADDAFVDVSVEPGRTYFYRVGEGESLRVDTPDAPKRRRRVVTRARERFVLRMGGALDEANTLTWEPETYCPGPNSSNPPPRQVFQPNLYVVVENVGDSDVVNPWIVVNGRRDWWSAEDVARDVVAGRDLDEGEKATAVWRFCVENIYDSRGGLSWFDANADPVRMLNVYGFDGCVAQAVAARRIAEAMGLRAREVWLKPDVDSLGRGRCCQHDILEVWNGESWSLLDTDMGLFFLRRDNATPAGAEDLAEDLDLLRRQHGHLGLPGRDVTDRHYYEGSFARRDFLWPPAKGADRTDEGGEVRREADAWPPPHTMALRLRPGERLIRYWDNVGKTAVRGRRISPELRYSNGRIVYAPDLRGKGLAAGAERIAGLVQEPRRSRPALRPKRARKTAEAVWKVESPWAVVGGRVRLRYRLGGKENGIEVLFSRDGRRWRSVWFARGKGRSACVDLDFDLNPALHDWAGDRLGRWRLGPAYGYFVKVALRAGSDPTTVGLDAVEIDSDILCATASLPALTRGANTVEYRDDTQGPRRVRITYGWQEDRETDPPLAPELVFPAADADVPALDCEFRWRRPKRRGARVDDYHIQVSRYADFRWPVCPTFDRYVSRTAWAGKTRWRPQFAGLLNPDETYCWRVRARNAKGVWGPWSEGRAFTPHGPRHPVGLAVRRRKSGRVLVWKPDARGETPVKYEVHASAEKGFSVSAETLVGKTDVTEWTLAARRGKAKVFHRVVAVDARGARSVPSEQIGA